VIRKLKECDPDRPVTFADCRCSKSVCLDLADILSLNLYPGWYSGDLDNVVPAIRDIIKLARKKGGDKPLIISEIGAGAIYGWRDEQEARWTEQFQSKLIRLVCEETIQNKGINGLAIWQYCDCRTHQNVKALFRPRAFNNKGLLDEYRRKKSAYDVVRTIFTGSHSQ
jgi:beta-glucuronidase